MTKIIIITLFFLKKFNFVLKWISKSGFVGMKICSHLVHVLVVLVAGGAGVVPVVGGVGLVGRVGAQQLDAHLASAGVRQEREQGAARDGGGAVALVAEGGARGARPPHPHHALGALQHQRLQPRAHPRPRQVGHLHLAVVARRAHPQTATMLAPTHLCNKNTKI
jgi:hypothetical protein